MVDWKARPKNRLDDLGQLTYDKIKANGSEATFEEMFGMSYADFAVFAVGIVMRFFNEEDFDDPEVRVKLFALGFLLGGTFQGVKADS